MPNNLIVDVSEINSAIARITSLENGANTPHSTIGTAHPVFLALDASHQQLKIYGNYFAAQNWTATTKDNNSILTKKVTYSGVNFSINPIVTVTYAGDLVQQVILQVKDITKTGCTIVAIKLDKKSWSADQKKFGVYISAIGY